MKKKLVLGFLIGAGIIGSSTTATFAAEKNTKVVNNVVEVSRGVNSNKSTTEVSEDAMTELKYSIEEMRIAITRMDDEGITTENKDYIAKFGETAVERVRPYFNELANNKETKGHLEFISNSWGEILTNLNEFEAKNNDKVSEDAMTALKYSIEEMRIAINRMDDEGITAENKDYIEIFGETAVQRVRPYFDELAKNEETKGHLQSVSNSWDEIATAISNFENAQ